MRFERRLRSDCVHEQVAKRIANVRLTLQKGHLKNQVPHCIIYLEDDRKRVPVALGKLMSKEIKHPTLGGGMLISFYVDLCKSMP